MIVTLIIWACLAFLSITYGVGGIIFLHRYVARQKTAAIPLSIIVLLGLSITAWLSSLLSLATGLGLFANLLVLAGAFFILFRFHGEVRDQIRSALQTQHWMTWMLIAAIFVTTLLYAVKPPGNPDTLLYHAQAIHWIEEYPAVPGLGNLEPRLGSNSNWFTLNALFSFSFLGPRSFHLIPSFLFLISLLYFAGGFQKLIDGDVRISQIVKLAFIPLAFYALLDEISSPGTDLPVILFYWVILGLWLESIENSTDAVQGEIAFIFSILVVTFKLSGITIALIALQMLLVFLRNKEHRAFWNHSALAALILLPWLLRNFILTGYWLYPEPALQFLSLPADWRIPAERVLTFKRGVQAWALAPGTTWDEIADLSLLQRLRYWFSELTLNQKGTVFSALISPVLYGIFSFLSQPGKKSPSYLSVVALGFVSFLFWLLTAPNLRFGYGFVFGVIALAFAPLTRVVFQRVTLYRLYLLSVIALVLFAQQVYVILGSTRDDTRYGDYVFLPADYPHVPVDSCSLDGIDILCARKYRQCSYDAFPCVPQIPKDVELRGETFREGFRRSLKEE